MAEGHGTNKPAESFITGPLEFKVDSFTLGHMMESAELSRLFLSQFAQVSRGILPTQEEMDETPNDEIIPYACSVFDQFLNDVETAHQLRLMGWVM